jgi:molybdopterin synthase sulfur carrier subunit
MTCVRFTPHLRRYFDLPLSWEVEGAPTVAALFQRLDERWPGLAFYVTDERGHLRKHVAVWVDGAVITDRITLTDDVPEDATVDILQALSGG